MNKFIVGELLRKKRKEEKGVTLEELYKRTGIAVSHLSEVENGKTSVSFEKLSEILEALGIKFSTFMAEVESEVEKKKREFKYEFSHNDIGEVKTMIEQLEKNGACKSLIQRLREKLRVPEWLKEESRRAYIRETFKNDLPFIGDEEPTGDVEADEA